MEARDPALAVVAAQTGVRRRLRAGEAMAARATNGRRDELAAGKAVPASLDDRQRLVPEHEHRLVRRWDPEQALRDLAVGAANADFEGADEYLALTCLHSRNLFDAGCVRVPRLHDERLHLGRCEPAVDHEHASRHEA